MLCENKGNLTQNGVGMPSGESSQALPLHMVYTIQQKKDFLSAQQQAALTCRQWEATNHFELSSSFHELLFKTTPPNFLFPL